MRRYASRGSCAFDMRYEAVLFYAVSMLIDVAAFTVARYAADAVVADDLHHFVTMLLLSLRFATPRRHYRRVIRSMMPRLSFAYCCAMPLRLMLPMVTP